MTHDEIYAKVRDVLVEALGVDEDEISPNASLFADLGAESIDVLDIIFQLERTFGFKIGQGELFPDNVGQDPRFVQAGRVTPEGLAALKARLPHLDFSEFEKDPQVSKVKDVFTVSTLVTFVAKKLNVA